MKYIMSGSEPIVLSSSGLKVTEIPNYLAKQRELFGLPLDFANATPVSIFKTFRLYCDMCQATYDHLATVQELSFATVVQPRINLSFAEQPACVLMTNPKDIHPDEKVRDAAVACSEAISDFDLEQEMREDVYIIFKRYYDIVFAAERAHLTHEEQKYVEDLMLEYRRMGMTLATQQQREELKEIQQRLATLGLKFQQNLNEDTTSFELSKNELDGLPESWFTADRQVPDKPDTYNAKLDYPDVFPILDFCTNRETRKKMFVAFNSKCREQNTPLALETLQLRQRMATLLGYASAADYATELNMAKNAANVSKFIAEMNERFKPHLVRTLDAVRDFARECLQDPTFELQYYDMRFFTTKREQALCDIDHKTIQDYFPRDKVVQGTLDIYQEIFGLKLVLLETANKWHEDTQQYAVYDAATNEHLGGFILDLAPRQGKYGHAGVGDMIFGGDASKLTGKADDRVPHLAVMLCNFAKNGTLKFDEVKMFVHELGHVVHTICSKVQLPCHNGFKVELDFVEAPSQMLENWCLNQAVLKRISAHKDTGEPIPAEKVLRICEAERLHIAYASKRQLGFSTFDYWIHTLTAAQLQNLDLNEVWNKMSTHIMQLPNLDVAVPAGFHHIFANEYFCGYYGYMYSNVVALCMFAEIFGANPLSPEAGRRYRKFVLEPGATKPASDLLRDFLGHDPTPDAFLRHFGLDANIEQEPAAKKARLAAS